MGMGLHLTATGLAVFVLLPLSGSSKQALLIGQPLVIEIGGAGKDSPLTSLEEALRLGRVEITFSVVGKPTDSVFRAEIHNRGDQPVRLLIPSGTVLIHKSDNARWSDRPTGISLSESTENARSVSLPLVGGTVQDLPLYCLEYHRDLPTAGDRYELLRSAPAATGERNGIRAILDVYNSGQIKLLVRSHFPKSWIPDGGSIDSLEKRSLSLALWAAQGSRGATGPMDYALLPVVREILRRADVADPYAYSRESPVSTVGEQAGALHVALRGEPVDFAAEADSLAQPGFAMADLDGDGFLYLAACSSSREQRRHVSWIVDPIEAETARAIVDTYERDLPSGLTPVDLQVSPSNRAEAEKEVRRVSGGLSQSAINRLARLEKRILLQIRESGQDGNPLSLEGALEGDAQTPALLREEWELLPARQRSDLLLYLGLWVEATLAADQETKDFVANLRNSLPAESVAFLGRHEKDLEAFCKREGQRRMLPLSADGDGLNALREMHKVLEEEKASDGQHRAVEDAYRLLADSQRDSELRDRFRDNRIHGVMEREGRRALEAMAATLREGRRELFSTEAIQSLGEAVRRTGGIEQIPDSVQGAKALKTASRFLLRLRSQTPSGSSFVLLRPPPSLLDADLPFWNVFLESTGAAGFEVPMALVLTRKDNLGEALENLRYRPAEDVQNVLVFTLPTELSESEFAGSDSSYVRAFRARYPKAAEYNRFVGNPLEEEVQSLAKSRPGLRVIRTYEDLVRYLTQSSQPKDITLSLTLLAHTLDGKMRIEFLDRPKGVTPEELKREIVSMVAPTGRTVNLELNLIACHAQAKGLVDTLLEVSAVRSAVAPRGEIVPQLGLYLYRRALELQKPGEAFWISHCNACREYLGMLLGPTDAGKSLSDPMKLESPDSLPEPRVEERSPRMFFGEAA